MKLIWKLLRRHLSVVQLAGFMLTNLVGVAIVLTAIQLYRDVQPVLSEPDSFLGNDYMILSKQVEGVGVAKTFFTRQELDQLRSQPFVADLGEFTPARYNVMGGIRFMGVGFQTYLFFEAVPDQFLDVSSQEWKFEPGDRTIPIIIPRNYLNLYNFGFASTQGLPQVGEDMISKLTLEIELRGHGRRENFDGRIVAFSNRLNTILVPESFITWSNERFGDKPATEPSRIIIEVPNAADQELHAYLKSHGYVVEGDNQDGGRMSYYVRLVTGIVSGIGILITLLSFFILMLSIFLLVQKNTRKLEDLLMLGYTPSQVSRPYQLLTLALNLLVLVLAVPIVLWAQSFSRPLIEMLTDSYQPVSIWVTLLIGLAITAVVTAINSLAIRRKVKQLWWKD